VLFLAARWGDRPLFSAESLFEFLELALDQKWLTADVVLRVTDEIHPVCPEIRKAHRLAVRGRAYLARAEAQSSREDAQLAVNEYDAALRLGALSDGQVFWTAMGLASGLERLDRKADALDVLRDLTSGPPLGAIPYRARAALLLKLGAFADAKATLRSGAEVLKASAQGFPEPARTTRLEQAARLDDLFHRINVGMSPEEIESLREELRQDP
jgi:hypothetical protein